jgi:hypothetical protein
VSSNGRTSEKLSAKIQPYSCVADFGPVRFLGNFRIWNLKPRVDQRTDGRPVNSPSFAVFTHNFGSAHFDVAYDSRADCNEDDPCSLGHKGGQTSGFLSCSSWSLRSDLDRIDAVSCSLEE